MASPLWQYYQDPAHRDLIEMLQHSASGGDVAAQRELATLTSTGIIPGLSGTVTPNYLGNVVSGRPRMTRPVGMTDADADYWTRYGGPFNLMSRQPAQGAARGVTAMPRAGSQPYADLAKWRATQTSPLPMGLPSGYGQEEGGMNDPYTGLRPSGTFARGGQEHDPRFGGRWDFKGGPQPMGWLRYGTGGTSPDPVSAGHVGGDGEGRTRGVEAEEGPGTGKGPSRWSPELMTKVSEMIAAAGEGMDKGTALKTGGGTRKYPGPYMAGPRGIAAFAEPYLRGKKKREDEIYG